TRFSRDWSSDVCSSDLFDVAIDFSLPDGFDAILAACLARGAGLVSGTTGLSAPQHAAIGEAGARIGILWSANFSLGVALLEELRSEERRVGKEGERRCL